MAANHRIFTSFAMENIRLRDFLVGQARQERSSFSFVDMSVKQPWDSSWKTNCRQKIKGCDGIIGLITSDTPNAAGQLWELQCGYQEYVPVLLIYGNDSRPSRTPIEISGRRIHLWTWANISNFLAGL